jgi:AcrR family transcriptional regulator
VPRTGRRRGESRTRETIIAAARVHFGRHGYDRATIRAIARSARVDPRLVMHFFGSKHQVFVAAMDLPIDPAELIQRIATPGVRGIGERAIRAFIGVWDSPEGRHLPGLIRSIVGHEIAATLMREFFAHAVLGRIAASLPIDHPRRRASLVASQLFGLALVRYVVKLEPIASANVDQLAAWIGPNLQRYFTADLKDIQRSGPNAPRQRIASRSQPRSAAGARGAAIVARGRGASARP